MTLKNKLLIALAAFSIYALCIFIYFSTKPTYKDYCPITMPGELPLVLTDPIDPQHTFKTINDISCLNKTRVYDVISVKSVDDIQGALAVAREKNLHISLAGVRHSMGGQAFFTDSLVLDMSGYNKIIALDETHKILTVQSGATWHDIQLYLHPKNLAVKAMQSTDIFTVGGSLSVNAHGMDHRVGSMASTIKSFTLMLADGSVRHISPTTDSELFNAVVGGYGLFGIVLEVELEVTDNVMYEREMFFLDCDEFPDFFQEAGKNYELLYAHLSTSPFSFFKNMIVYGYKKRKHTGPFPPLHNVSLVSMRRFLINLAKRRHYARVTKWIAEKYIDPALDKQLNNTIASRNAIMHDSVEYLENVLINETDILHEYFIPRKHLLPFIKQVGALLKKSGISVLNASIRVVHKESTMLNYAPENMFALVLYLNQRVNKKALAAMTTLTRELIDLTLKFKGTFFLPYQLQYTQEQLSQAYPNINEFFALKRKYDPELLFMNSFYAKYASADV